MIQHDNFYAALDWKVPTKDIEFWKLWNLPKPYSHIWKKGIQYSQDEFMANSPYCVPYSFFYWFSHWFGVKYPKKFRERFIKRCVDAGVTKVSWERRGSIPVEVAIERQDEINSIWKWILTCEVIPVIAWSRKHKIGLALWHWFSTSFKPSRNFITDRQDNCIIDTDKFDEWLDWWHMIFEVSHQNKVKIRDNYFPRRCNIYEVAKDFQTQYRTEPFHRKRAFLTVYRIKR